MVSTLTASTMVDSVLIRFSYFTRSQKCTYAIDSAKNAIVTAIQKMSCMIQSPENKPNSFGLDWNTITPARF